jgi:hypothetical protein
MISMVKYLKSHGVRPFVHAKHNIKGRTTAMHTHREWGKREARAGGGALVHHIIGGLVDIERLRRFLACSKM